MIGILVLSFLNQKNWGDITLHETIIQYAHAYGPKALFIKQMLHIDLLNTMP